MKIVDAPNDFEFLLVNRFAEDRAGVFEFLDGEPHIFFNGVDQQVAGLIKDGSNGGSERLR